MFECLTTRLVSTLIEKLDFPNPEFKGLNHRVKLKQYLGILLKVLRNIEIGNLNLYASLLINSSIKKTEHLIDAIEAVQE